MKKFNFIFKKSFWKNVLAVVLILILAAGIIGGGIALGKYIKDKKKSPTVTWERGSIAADGKVNSDKNSIHTKDVFECRGLEIIPSLEENVTYCVAFYDGNKDFIEKTEYMSGKFLSTQVPFFAQYARVEVNAGRDENGEKIEIGLLKILNYSKQVSIKVDKKQSSLAARVKNVSAENVITMYGEGYVNHETGEQVLNENTNMYMADPINVSDVSSVIVKVKSSTLTHRVTVFNQVLPGLLYYKVKDGRVIGNINNTTYVVCYTEDDYTYVYFNVSDCDSFILSVDEDSSEILEAYLFN